MVGFLIVVILVLVVAGLSYVIAHFMRKSLALKEGDMNTDLEEFRESHAVSRRISISRLPNTSNVSELYERMCVKDPLKYRDHPSLPMVINEYKAVVSGKKLDPSGSHIPSEYINGSLNPDYARYISNQILVHEHLNVSGNLRYLKSERDRIERRGDEAAVKLGFIEYLRGAGLPDVFLGTSVVSVGKLNTYSEGDWKLFSKTVKVYLRTYAEEEVHSFVSMFDDISIITDADKMQVFSIYSKNGVPEGVVRPVIVGEISDDQAYRITELVQKHGRSWEGAMKFILEQDLRNAEADDLRALYHKKTL